MIVLRYVLARPAIPKQPKHLANGSVSTQKKQDTTAEWYADACKLAGQEMCQETYEHFKERDRRAWSWVMDFPVTQGEAESVTSELGFVPREMRSLTTVPGRNPWACSRPRCDWLDLCHANPSGDVGDWWGVEPNDYSGLKGYEITYKNGVKKQLLRDNPGVVVSPSEMRAFLTCRRKWWFEYAEKCQVARSNTNYGPRMRGIMAHQAAEIMARELVSEFPDGFNENIVLHISSIPTLKDQFITWCEERFPDVRETEDFLKDRENAFYAGQRMFWKALADMDRVVSIEQRYAVLLPGTKTWVTCQPDIVCQKGEDTYVIDYKTSSSSNLNRTAEDYRYNPALYIYALALTNGYEAMEVTDV
mgnify:FL=1|tara:strand:+ start:9469 stop:10551 length:1083 start_codon:yes stop_codon:yes gene_type:complete